MAVSICLGTGTCRGKLEGSGTTQVITLDVEWWELLSPMLVGNNGASELYSR